jgi:predicted ABC-type ATPase
MQGGGLARDVVLSLIALATGSARSGREAGSRGRRGIPSDVVIRRYKASLANMQQLYLPLADVAIYDNSDKGRSLIAERVPNAPFVVHDAARWSMIERALQ